MKNQFFFPKLNNCYLYIQNNKKIDKAIKRILLFSFALLYLGCFPFNDKSTQTFYPSWHSISNKDRTILVSPNGKHP